MRFHDRRFGTSSVSAVSKPASGLVIFVNRDLPASIVVVLSIARRRRAVRVLALTKTCKEHVSPFLRKFTKLSPLNLQDAPCLAFFLTQSRLRSRRVIPVLQRVLISLRRAARFAAVHPAAAVFHRCRSTWLSTALRSSPAARAQMHREFALHGVEHLSRGSVWGWISPEP
jgi:hypothetical protein